MSGNTLSKPLDSNLLPNTSPIPAKSVTGFSPIGSDTKLWCFCDVVDILHQLCAFNGLDGESIRLIHHKRNIMSKATKKKHVTQEVLNHFDLPQDNQQIVKVIASRGNNLHQVVTPDGDNYLVSMPPKFRKWIWIKRGDYLIVDPIEEGNKVKAEITNILLKEQIKYIKDEGKWSVI
ncbi:unnamed protein product [Oppiella nova]|uniref:Probable RNA-binding protein EIF1AD n=1 Tax=Oppiella nova TaxID=334625 RepID=A0A7R9LBQ1_9ACAR|nr:unnamed protein product [Oppiella nova]CAG2161890.1 unnamed protein product [Oppiella nova]